MCTDIMALECANVDLECTNNATVSTNIAWDCTSITLHCTDITCEYLRTSSAHLQDLSRSAAFPASGESFQRTSEVVIHYWWLRISIIFTFF